MTGRVSVSRRATVLFAAGILAGCLGDDTSADDADDTGGIPGPMIDGIELRSSFPLLLVDPETGDLVADIHYHDEFSHWHRQPFEVPANDERTVIVELYLPDGEQLDIDEAGLVIEAEILEATPEDFLEITVESETITFDARAEGEGEIRLHVQGPEGDTWSSPELAIETGTP